MARLILDTSVVIGAHRLGTPIADLYADDDDVAISAITASELLAGVALVHQRRRDQRAKQVEDVLTAHPIEEFGVDAARAHSRLLAHVRKAGRPRGAHDLLIAATAISTGRTILTSDARGFTDLPGVNIRSVPTR